MVTRSITNPRVRVRIQVEAWKISGTLFSVPRLARSLVLVYPDSSQGASRVSVLYIGHKKINKFFIPDEGNVPKCWRIKENN